ncbi:MAG TPA: photosystem reaction center subunit H [Methanotrichaceae archaeon]|nr:photosystem reaction center subunit H [Methanotrichaceae archaeon]
MSRIYARSLAGKEIVTMGGTVLGELENIILDPETGKLIDLLVKPDSELELARYRKEGKLILVPFHSVCALKDYIVVDEKRAER